MLSRFSLAAIIGGLLNLLYVDNAPDHLRPYVIRQYATAQSTMLPREIFRFYITGASSNNAFTLLTANAPGNPSWNVLPHIHERHFENFYCFKGRYQLWAQAQDNTTQQTRVLTQGDFGAVVRNSTHTFQTIDPDTQLGGMLVPGGFEELFLTIGNASHPSTHSPYDPAFVNQTYSLTATESDIGQQQAFDVYSQLRFQPRRDAINGTAPAGTTWHTGPNQLAEFGRPYFIANGFGPKFLNNESSYQVIQPLVSPTQAGDLNFTMSTITVSTTPPNVTVPTWNLNNIQAFQVLEGMLSIQIASYDVANLTTGDSDPYFTKAMLMSQGYDGVDQQLISRGFPWDSAMFPNRWS
ncbi:quercetin 2,3-dioxygenase anaerobically complexed with the substrate kaempferol [Aspergillus sclerotiicarbonarius CBS 121057]|uniref:Quercetin 2,3-dioxygenase anaerobically complexed with the substrate kaempferol n=1 Tax=Aspergillus sclerotiicarbonarius (strain CBS 121057 / IBT 28362) TaxID=1448318 RepID=A0A319E4T4_ASPSB|nr:quercetin 2,3-dioxygenase anaerobically complexed with the substrate kaempferol [Aspergillus sclerotiicarbonarius CBS 121057]